MREIKFRMWNPLRKGFHKDVEEVFECLMQQIRHDGTMDSRYKKLSFDHVECGIIWDQFIGKKDKTGNEIYERDIVEFMYKNPNDSLASKKVRCVIEFHDGAFCLVWPDGYKNSARLNPEKYTVVGNIHENPELLK